MDDTKEHQDLKKSISGGLAALVLLATSTYYCAKNGVFGSYQKIDIRQGDHSTVFIDNRSNNSSTNSSNSNSNLEDLTKDLNQRPRVTLESVQEKKRQKVLEAIEILEENLFEKGLDAYKLTPYRPRWLEDMNTPDKEDDEMSYGATMRVSDTKLGDLSFTFLTKGANRNDPNKGDKHAIPKSATIQIKEITYILEMDDFKAEDLTTLLTTSYDLRVKQLNLGYMKNY